MVQTATTGEAPHIYFNGVKMPTPSVLEVGIQDVDFDTGRTADGMMHRNRVSVKRKIKVGWPASPPERVSQILSAVWNDSVTVTYLDPQIGGMATGTFYAGDRVAPMFNYSLMLYDAFSFDLVEF